MLGKDLCSLKNKIYWHVIKLYKYFIATRCGLHQRADRLKTTITENESDHMDHNLV